MPSTQDLLRMTSAERAALPGVDARRADLLPAGALLAMTVLDLTGLDELVGCEWALREGMVLDAIGQPLPGRVERGAPGHAAGVGAGPVPALRLERSRTPPR